jgi:hypothetical protein
MSSNRRFDPDEPLPLQGGALDPPPAPELPTPQPQLLWVLVPALLLEVSLHISVLLGPPDAPKRYAYFSIVAVLLVSVLIVLGLRAPRWLLTAFWLLRSIAMYVSLATRGFSLLILGVASAFVVASALLLLVPLRRRST